MTAYCSETGKDVEQAVAEMRQVVFEETQLTVSAGIAANKVGGVKKITCISNDFWCHRRSQRYP
jgi:impB/mucB/samB family